MTDEEIEYCTWLTKTTEAYRGKILDRAILAEQMINRFLVYYFVKKGKTVEFEQLILYSMDLTFNTKINIFKSVLEDFIPDLYDKYESDIKRLDALRGLRNKMAHLRLELTEESVAKNYKDFDHLHFFDVKKYRLKHVKLSIKTLDRQLTEFVRLNGGLSDLIEDYLRYHNVL